MTAPVLKDFRVMGFCVITSMNVKWTFTIAVPVRSARIELVLSTAPACQDSMEMGGYVKMPMSANSRLLTAVDMHSAQTVLVITIALAVMALRVTDGRALTLMKSSVQPKFITAVCMHSA